VQFNDIMMLGGDETTLGAPTIAGAAVQAEVLGQIKGEKVLHFVKRRRKHSSKRTKGHRQQLTVLRVTDILASGADGSGVKAAVGTGGLPRAKPADAEAPAAKAKPAKAKAAPKAKAEPKADAAQDDLKQLSGVGPALEKKLHAAGVTSYAQIADWTAADLDALDASISAKAEKEGWVAQAKDLAK
ncbi:50S ribosomal protein L21, partial [Brevirhabdus sp.]|uniref:50S ribosomal protein L21 n=1 Tax=Brevirhabdus sp. TaxID=2004514 RepID=UPI00405A24CE